MDTDTQTESELRGPKVEAYVSEQLKADFVEVCRRKRTSQADGLRRAMEAWVDDERAHR